MIDVLLRGLGRVSLVAEPLRRLLAGRRPVRTSVDSAGGEDKTGLILAVDRTPGLLHDDAGIRYADFDSFAHSFWRAQELSLLRARRTMFAAPSLDFGCGDGAFAAALGIPVTIGADSDPEARGVAEARGTYSRVVGSTAGRLDLADGAVSSAFANSVLEHVDGLPAVLRDLHRVLADHAPLVITVPTDQYTVHLSRYFGPGEAARINAESAHRTLWTPTRWRAELESAGFDVVEMVEYQPPRFTYLYRMSRLLGRRGLGLLIPGLATSVWRRYRETLVAMVRRSIAGTPGGANVLIVSRARPTVSSA